MPTLLLPFSVFSACVSHLFLCLITILLFPCATVMENTPARVPHCISMSYRVVQMSSTNGDKIWKRSVFKLNLKLNYTNCLLLNHFVFGTAIYFIFDIYQTSNDAEIPTTNPPTPKDCTSLLKNDIGLRIINMNFYMEFHITRSRLAD